MLNIRYVLCLALLSGSLLACSGDGSGDSDDAYMDRMETEHEGDTPSGNASAAFPQDQEVDTMQVQYATVDGEAITGYLARPQGADGDLPGILVIHEWWGLNDNIRMMTRRLAGQGYVALAVDLYSGKVAETADSAGQYARASRSNPEAGVNNIGQALEFLDSEYSVTGVGTIGWCFGGGWSLQAALEHPGEIDAAVIYYGNLVTDAEQLSRLDMPVLGIFGEEDEGIPPSQVERFETVLDSLGKDASIHIYENADHAFANPSGDRYNEEAATDAWQKTVDFLGEHLNNN